MSYVIAVILGVFSWTFLEYAIHNWVGHMLKGKTIFSKEHLKHHAVNGYFSPASKKALTAVMIMGIISPIAIAPLRQPGSSPAPATNQTIPATMTRTPSQPANAMASMPQ